MSFADNYNDAPSRGFGRQFPMNPPPFAPQPTVYSTVSRNEASLQTLGDNIVQITTHVSTIKQCSDKIGTNKDSNDSREKLRESIDRVKILSKETASLIKTIQIEGTPEEKTRKKQQHQRLAKDFQVILQSFQEISKVAGDKERVHPVPKQNTRNSQPVFVEESQSSPKIGLLETSKLQQIENDRIFNDQLIQQRDQDIRQIEQTVVQVNEIFRDLAHMVDEQGVMIDNIQSNIEDSHSSTTRAVEELRSASTHQRSARSKMCWIALILLVIVVIIVVVFYFVFRK